MQKISLELKKTDYRTKEAYKTLRTNIEFCGRDIKTIALTSSTPNEGKTSVAIELAKTFAEAGNRTILIDCDMRKSVLIGRHNITGAKVGLTHCLAGMNELTDVICQTNVKNLYLITAGPVPPNPSELLGTEDFSNLIKTLRETFDYVLLDTPPLGSVIDAAVVANICDGTLLVIENNAISYRFAQKVKDQLDKAGCRILGAVLNKVEMKARGKYGYGYGYGKYYGKYYGANYGNEEESDKTLKDFMKELEETKIQPADKNKPKGK